MLEIGLDRRSSIERARKAQATSRMRFASMVRQRPGRSAKRRSRPPEVSGAGSVGARTGLELYMNVGYLAGEPEALSFISISPRRIEHHSLWSAIGMPHSTQTLIRCLGGSVFPNRRFHNVMPPPMKANDSEYV